MQIFHLRIFRVNWREHPSSAAAVGLWASFEQKPLTTGMKLSLSVFFQTGKFIDQSFQEQLKRCGGGILSIERARSGLGRHRAF